MLRLVYVILVSFVITTSVNADLRLCNITNNLVNAAIAYVGNDKVWISEGWWNIKAKSCTPVIKGKLIAQFYYIYAIDSKGGEWKNRFFMCTKDKNFIIKGRKNCYSRGFDRIGFFEVDTQDNVNGWTVQLSGNDDYYSYP